MTQDILKTAIETQQDNPYYEALLTAAQAQLEASVRSEQRFEVTVKTLTDKRTALEGAMIAAWDDIPVFAALKAEYEGLSTVFALAPLALRHWQERSTQLRHYMINIRGIRDHANTERREQEAEAERRRQQLEQQAAWKAEREAKQAERQRVKDMELADVHARNAALYERQATDTADSLAWLKKLTGSK